MNASLTFRFIKPIGYALYPQYAFAHASQQAPPQMVYQKEEHVRAHVSRAKSPKPATAQPNMMYPVPEGYTAVPYAYTMPNYPVPVHASTAGRSADDEDEVPAAEKPSKVWVGRTKKQVDEDNVKIAVNEGIYGFNEIMPKNARPDQLFWVIELDGTNTLRTFRSIDNGHLGKGIWKVDPRHGNAYFVLAKEEVKFEKDKKRRKSR